MRVIAGQFRGRRLRAPKGPQVRPTSDRVKEALFSILGAHVVGARVLDLYAGTGALGIEAISRGAAAVTFVEQHPATVTYLRQNLSLCGPSDRAAIHTGSVDRFLSAMAARPASQDAYGLLLADPPYDQLDDVLRWSTRIPAGLLADEAIAVVEHRSSSVPPPQIGHLTLARTYRYGDTALSVFRPELGASEAQS